MGGSNPLRGVTSVVRGTGRAVRENPEKAALTGISPLLLVNEGIEEEQKRVAKQNAGKVSGANQAAAQATTDKLTAEESVRAQKEKSRKQTIFGGSSESSLFNRSLIGASTTAAGSGARSILGT